MAKEPTAGQHDLAQRALVRFAALVELSPDFIAMADLDGTVIYVNAAGRELVGSGTLEESVGLTTDEYFTDGGRGASRQIEEAVRERGSWQGESLLRHFVTGETIPVSVNSFLVVHPETQEPLALATVQRDLRPQKAIESRSHAAAERLRISEAQQRAVAALGKVALDTPLAVLLDSVVRIVAQTLDAGEAEISRLTSDGDTLLAVAIASTQQDQGPGERRTTPLGSDDPRAKAWENQHAVVEAQTVAVTVSGPGPGSMAPWGVLSARARPGEQLEHDPLTFLEAVAGVLSSAISRAAMEDRWRHEAVHDPLTGLPNRMLATDRLEHALERSRASGRVTAVMVLDLDDFKTVNDSLGHEAGNALLVAVADRLRASVGPQDTVARLGGDEFVVICEDLDGELDALAIAETLRSAWADPVELGGVPVHVAGSIGLSFVTSLDHVSAPELLRQADMAMYHAKARRLGGVDVFDQRMRESALRRLSLASSLRQAIDDNGLGVNYQPIVDLSNGGIAAVEALARWQLDDTAVPPTEFIPVAERTGLIRPLGEWILFAACRTVAGWTGGQPKLRVNVSPRQLADAEFPATVARALREAGLAPERLGLELTEAALFEDSEVGRASIARLRELGVELLLDDFGTGYSALSYLHRFPQISSLKIDRSFVDGLLRRKSDATIVSAVLAIAREFGLSVVAEGIEDPQQLEQLRRMGCPYGQGFLLGRPVPAQELADQLVQHGSGQVT